MRAAKRPRAEVRAAVAGVIGDQVLRHPRWIAKRGESLSYRFVLPYPGRSKLGGAGFEMGAGFGDDLVGALGVEVGEVGAEF